MKDSVKILTITLAGARCSTLNNDFILHSSLANLFDSNFNVCIVSPHTKKVSTKEKDFTTYFGTVWAKLSFPEL